ncbi:GAF domain-containing sensor histidine kinase [Patescibacteria group bacterium]|nr:GAF domain-containing sensor histidine kinase [Patescibacteria group bacterium]MBU1673397.1 GAF domain-containing sensor histidine kinase [Patescibacteria group bacterium]MBU1963301.1 GAF domain-containing sensor histidine kinase [Patescibacteria group bacterium]
MPKETQKTLEKLAYQLNTKIKLSEVIRLIIDTVVNALELKGASVVLIHKNQISQIVDFNFPGAQNIAGSEDFFNFTREENRPLTTGKQKGGAALRIKELGGEVVLPMVNRDELIGLIVLGDKANRKVFTKRDLELLDTISNQAAIAIENAILYERMDIRVKEQTKEIKNLYKIKSDFLTIASHQLRTPTSIIRGMLSMMCEDDMPPEERLKMAPDAFQAANNLEKIVHDILIASEIDAGELRTKARQIDFINVVDQAVEGLQKYAGEKGVRLAWKKPAGKLIVSSEEIMLKEAVSHLVENGLNYTEKGDVAVNLAKKEKSGKEYAVLECKDTGVGLTEKDKKNIAAKFYRGERVIGMHPNASGLGLFIIKGIIEPVGGWLYFISQGKGRGSTFQIWLPLA